MRCHCGGDIDDIELEGTSEHINCIHCNSDDWDEDEYSCELCGNDECTGRCFKI